VLTIQGYILESSPLPRPPLTHLGLVDLVQGTFLVALDRQSREDAQVNGKQDKYTYRSAGWRNPLVLYVDGVVGGHLRCESKFCANSSSSMRETLEQSRAPRTF
jgi:hypothetical protein